MAGVERVVPANERIVDLLEISLQQLAKGVTPDGLTQRIEAAEARAKAARERADAKEKADREKSEAEAAIAEANNVTVDVVPMHYEYRNEVFFDRLILPAQARLREVVPIRMILRADRPARGTIYLSHNGQPVPLGDSPEELGKKVRYAGKSLGKR